MAEPSANQSSTKQKTSAPAPEPAVEGSAPADAIDEENTELVIELGAPEKPKVTKKVESPDTDDPKADGKSLLSDKEKARATRRSRLTKEALSFRGTPYIWGGEGRGGFDCSGFTQFIYGKRGVTIPRTAKQQFGAGTPVARNDLKKGDLVFFNTRGPISHVGMYIGNGKFVHAANRRRGVTVDSLGSAYYSKRYAGARRYTK